MRTGCSKNVILVSCLLTIFFLNCYSVHIIEFAVLVLILDLDRHAILLAPCYSSRSYLATGTDNNQAMYINNQPLADTICQECRTCCGERHGYREVSLPLSHSSYTGKICGTATVQSSTHSVVKVVPELYAACPDAAVFQYSFPQKCATV